MTPEQEFTLGVDLAQDSFQASIARGMEDLSRRADLSSVRIGVAPDSDDAARRLEAWIQSQTGGDERCVCIVVESTGGLSARFADRLRGGPLPEVSIVNPFRPKAFGQSLGVRSKTDRVDAAVLALYGVVHRPRPRPQPSPAERKLREMTRLREALLKDVSAWENRKAESSDKIARRLIGQTIRHLRGRLDAVDREIEAVVEQDAELRVQVRALEQIKGLGPVSARTITAELGDLTQYTRNELVARAGLFPVEFESGRTVRRRPRLAKGGGGRVRRVLYNCARSLFRVRGPLRDYIEGLKQRNLRPMQIIGALMRKLLLIARAVMKAGGVYDEEKICCAP